MARIKVDLPEPLGPTTAVTSPSARVRSRPVKRVRAPKATLRSLTRRVVGMAVLGEVEAAGAAQDRSTPGRLGRSPPAAQPLFARLHARRSRARVRESA